MPAKKPSRRVAAWIYAVINPIIDSLQRELTLLDSGNLTWRAHSGRCEMIRTIQEYVDSTQWPNYQDFLGAHPRSFFIPGFKQHDSKVGDLNTAAKVLFDRLISWPEFSTWVDAALTTYETRRASLGPQAPSFIHIRDDVRKEVAMHLINNVQTLPSHYVISPFWNFERNSLLTFRNRPEFRDLHRASESLSEISAKVKLALESFRLSLSRDYDVPAAPVPGVSLEE